MKSDFGRLTKSLRKRLNNENGFSAVELMAAVTIAGLILGAITAFLTANIRSFETTVDVIDVQYEGQLAYNALGKTAMESTGISLIFGKSGAEAVDTDKTNTSTLVDSPVAICFENSDGSAYTFYFDEANNKIIFKTETIEANKHTLDIGADDWYDFAFNVSGWTFDPGIDGATFRSTDHIQVTMDMEDGEISLNLSNLYKMRNKVN